jgi:hypothetical protein
MVEVAAITVAVGGAAVGVGVDPPQLLSSVTIRILPSTILNGETLFRMGIFYSCEK